MVDDLYTGILLVIETARECVAEYKDVNALILKVLLVIQLKRVVRSLVTCSKSHCCAQH